MYFYIMQSQCLVFQCDTKSRKSVQSTVLLTLLYYRTNIKKNVEIINIHGTPCAQGPFKDRSAFLANVLYKPNPKLYVWQAWKSVRTTTQALRFHFTSMGIYVLTTLGCLESLQQRQLGIYLLILLRVQNNKNGHGTIREKKKSVF